MTLAEYDVSKHGGGGNWDGFAPSSLARLFIALSRQSILGRGASRKFLYGLVAKMHPGPLDYDV